MKLTGPSWLTTLLCLAATTLPGVAEENLWPLCTSETIDSAQTTRTSGAGPFLFDEHTPEKNDNGFRPFFMRRISEDGRRTQDYFLYPFLYHDRRGSDDKWSFFSLVNSDRVGATKDNPESSAFDIWPFYFSRDTGDPKTSYQAVFPLSGTIHRRFGNDRVDFTLFPIYSRWQKGERVETDWLWPFIRETKGGGQAGFAVWPLYGWKEKDAGKTLRSEYILWPLRFSSDRKVEGGTDSFRALLPFYAYRQSPAATDKNILLFFGSTHQTSPVAYDETRYFWPLFVQGHGSDGRLLDRCAPFYSHSVRPSGAQNTWVMWPFYHQQEWTDAGLDQKKTQFLYFLYWDMEQRDPARPSSATAHKTHLWPLYSRWDNGAGRQQIQALSPFEVFFQHDDRVRQLWTPLFSVYRYDRRSPDEVAASYLFNCIAYRRRAERWTLDLGPLFRFTRENGRSKVAILPALTSRQRADTPKKPVSK